MNEIWVVPSFTALEQFDWQLGVISFFQRRRDKNLDPFDEALLHFRSVVGGSWEKKQNKQSVVSQKKNLLPWFGLRSIDLPFIKETSNHNPAEVDLH